MWQEPPPWKTNCSRNLLTKNVPNLVEQKTLCCVVGKWENRKLVCPNGPNWNVAIWSIFYSRSRHLPVRCGVTAATRRLCLFSFVLFIFGRVHFFSQFFIKTIAKRIAIFSPGKKPRTKEDLFQTFFLSRSFSQFFNRKPNLTFRVPLSVLLSGSAPEEAENPITECIVWWGRWEKFSRGNFFSKDISLQGGWDAPLNEFLVLASLALAPILCWFGERIFHSARAALWNVSWRRFIRDRRPESGASGKKTGLCSAGMHHFWVRDEFFFSLRKDNEFVEEIWLARNYLDIF